ncbi:sigma-70 family RNA polymerase sigma factor [Cryobacterium sp. PH31-L1]|uniref:RNA polymerase sigma factor n=1 Tax=Cryobacterium sp. PH31-L1 TaxID=3046199 RepID=UPI0024BAB5AB|nr:sigma-70 family RNA polymerase sigma factor [Cryobacterium sp. PH31-L1]MDJ0379201.1 sigma-70 family RNA polymerase sigma factor [Cryobacterium sp. PH31-L1]
MRKRIGELHERLASDLLNYLARRVDPPEDAADLLSETFLVAWRRSDRIPDDAEQSRMWMFVTARGVLANHHRGRRRRLALADTLRERLATSQRRSSSEENQTIVILDVRAALELLPNNQSELVRLVHWDGFTLIEAAQIAGVTESTARGRYERAKNRLRVALSEAEDEQRGSRVLSDQTATTA